MDLRGKRQRVLELNYHQNDYGTHLLPNSDLKYQAKLEPSYTAGGKNGAATLENNLVVS